MGYCHRADNPYNGGRDGRNRPLVATESRWQDETQARASAPSARATLLSYRNGRIVNRRSFRLVGYVGG